MPNNWGKWDDAHRGMHTGATTGASKLYQQIAAKAYRDTTTSGGVTISLKGSTPNNGFAYSPFKDTETKIPTEKFSEQDIDDFIDRHSDKLTQPGNHIGIWENSEDGHTYIDISKVGPPTHHTLQKAMDAKQLAAFDLSKVGTDEDGEIPLGKMQKGVYTKLYEASHHPYLNRGKNS